MRSKKLVTNSVCFSIFVKKRLIAFFAFCCMLLSPNFDLLAENSQIKLPLSSSSTSLSTKIYFYNPEINTARNLVLKSTWDNYLHEVYKYEFQPVDDESEFIRLVKEQNDSAFIMAEWFYSSIFSAESANQNLSLAFQGLRNGKNTYSKILVSNKGALDFENITIASSGSKERAKEILSSIYPELSSLQIDRLKLLIVPKDIDALMAVGYGLADMALSTEISLSKVSKLNKNLYKDMIVLRESKPLKRSVLVVKSTNVELMNSLSRLMINITNTPNGRQAMSLLGLDEWSLNSAFSAQISNHIMENKDKKGGHNNDN